MDVKLVISIVSGITAIISVFISCFGIVHNRFLAVDKFLTKIEDHNFVDVKKYIYNHNGPFDIDDEQAATIVNFFHHWGMLAKRHYLPMWVFDGATGRGMCRLYQKTKNYIDARRQYNNDSSYGEYFEWLNGVVERRLKRRRNF